MRLLWFSNCVLSNSNVKSTGSWLFAMSEALVCNNNIEIVNITISNNPDISEYIKGSIKDIVLPRPKKLIKGIPNKSYIDNVLCIIKSINPDLVHIWGMESFWGLLFGRIKIKPPTLLEIQGIKSISGEVYYGGLSFSEVISCIRIKELLIPKCSIIYNKYKFLRWGIYEDEMLKIHPFISTQSEWVRAKVFQECAEKTKVFETLMPIREAFMRSQKWENYYTAGQVKVLAFASNAIPYKGLHILIKAINLIKKNYPNIILKIAGEFEQTKPRYRKSGYMNFLHRLIRIYNLQSNVQYLGSLNANELVEEMLSSNILVQPSFVETYSLALAESMAVGIPCVISYSGAMTELAKDEESALYYSPTDYYKCSFQMKRLIESRSLSEKISCNSRLIAMERNCIKKVVKQQINIYNQVLNN